MRLPHSLKSTHWVMWSSPVLLLVLVFTLTASSSSTPARHLDSLTVDPPHTTPATSTSSPPTTTVPATTTTNPVHKRVTAALHVVHTTSRRDVLIPSVPTTIAVPGKNSSAVTASNVKSSVNESVDSASSGVVSGQLSQAFVVADVPLRGPGTWSVTTSAPAAVKLTCAAATISVEGQFEIAAHTTCQVTITPVGPNHSVTWELTPVS